MKAYVVRLLLAAILGLTHLLYAADDVQPQRSRYEVDYKTPAAFVNEFLDLTKKPEQPIKYWATQLVLLLQKEKPLKPFCIELIRALPYKNPTRIGCLFLLHRDHFSRELQQLVLSKNLKKVWTALEKRTCG